MSSDPPPHSAPPPSSAAAVDSNPMASVPPPATGAPVSQDAFMAFQRSSQDAFMAFQRQSQDFQRLVMQQLTALTSRMGAVEIQSMPVSAVADPSSSSHTFPPNPPEHPYGLPGYGGIPVVTSPTPAAPSVPPSLAAIIPQSIPTPTSALIPPATQRIPLPIQQIPFPHSPSPIPTFADVYPVAPAPPHHAPPTPHYHKLSFTTFDGREDPVGWLNRCKSFFRNQRALEADKVWLATYHLTGAAQQWYLMLERNEPGISWPRFKALCQQRFGPPLRSNTLGEVARLPFHSTVEDYQERFLALLYHAELVPPPHQQAQLFTAGLPGRLRVDVELCAPADLQQAMALARAYERHTSVPDGRFPRAALRTLAIPPSPGTTMWSPSVAPTRLPAPTVMKRLTPAEMDEHRRQGLCFNCDEPFVRGHPPLLRLELADDDDDAETVEPALDTDADTPVISLLAMAGLHTNRTMHMPAMIHGKRLVTLLDTSSTHNFVNTDIAAALGLQFTTCRELCVTVANGNKVAYQGRADHVPMMVQPEPFDVNFYAIPLGGFDVVLGVAFLCTVGPILWDLDRLCLSFRRQDRRVQWQGIGTSTRPATALSITAGDRPLLEDLLTAFDDVFAAPTGLPPARACNHRIHLRPSTPSVVVRPYRYAQLQKDELERQHIGLLRARPPRQKQDASWRFCIDYRALNDATAKDKLPIPVVDELLDELHGACFFTKRRSPSSVARAFFNIIVRLHGFPASIVSDSDPVFTSAVWRNLFKMAGVKLRMSTAFHPQTDGQSKVTNKTIAMYLRCITGDRPRAWVDWLPWAEYCYNTSYHTALRATPFQVVYGREPPALAPYSAGTTRTQTIDDMLAERDQFLSDVRDRLLQAQNCAKRYSRWAIGCGCACSIGRRPPWWPPQHQARSSLCRAVTEHVGVVAYRLQLPPGARIHDVFHVGLLKPLRGDPPAALPPLPPMEHVPAKVLKASLRCDVWHVLVHWAGDNEANATWEPLETFRASYPDVQLADELFLEAGRDVMTGIQYTRRNRQSG
ncbi:LOW QUALITY PROTEIN: hypothetical protein U9M48_024749 [Paspalum notatum var. saurae]|uniref:Integrase catalytic domain-containing protein n=1 Tax=Paspalum notatum var. saurae TaxID=547442 RepID=A0AAQ3TNZ3_PASNO